MHTFVSNSAENGPAMAGPAGPVPAPMYTDHKPKNTAKQVAQKTCTYTLDIILFHSNNFAHMIQIATFWRVCLIQDTSITLKQPIQQ